MRGLAEYLAYRALAFLVPLLPRFALVWLGRRLGALYYLASPTARAVGLDNLARALPDRTDHRSILRASLALQGVALLDALWSVRLRPERARLHVDMMEPLHTLLDEQMKKGRGLVLATAHFGSWEMLNVAAGAMGLPRATVIAREVRNPRIDRHLRERRERTGNQLVYREKAMLACMAALKRGEIVCSVIDMAVVPWQGGMFADFFGTPALTPAALALLAVRFRAPLAFAVCRPLDGGRRYRVHAEMIAVRSDAERDEEVRRVTIELNRALERVVCEQPEAWIWSYKRWKYRPCEQPGDYPDYSVWIREWR